MANHDEERRNKGSSEARTEEHGRTEESGLEETKPSRREIVEQAFNMSTEERARLFDEPMDFSNYYYTPQGELRKRVSHEEMEDAGVPKRLVHAKETFHPDLIEFLKTWLSQWKRNGEKPSTSFFITGEQLEKAERFIAMILKNVANRCATIYCISAMEFVENYRNNHEIEKKLSTVCCLAIMDFGSHYRDKEGYCDSLFTKLLTVRFNASLPTLICCPFSIEFLNRYYDPNPNENPLPDKLRAYMEMKHLLRIITRSFQQLEVE